MVVSAPAIKLAVTSHRRSVVPSLRLRCNLSFRVSCSGETATADESAASSSGDGEGGAVVGGGLGRPSIISTINVQKALRGLPITDVDYYGTLGVPKTASYEEIQTAYESKCEELKNREGLEEDLKTEFELLKESYTILSINEERRLYDWSLARTEQPDRYVWPYDVDYLEMSPEDPPAQEPEDEWPTKLVGYFFLAWILLSVVVSVSLNKY
ncbi:hypothetical protein LUZ60_004590 [Juncus effusus]|nr:hypothetical protein LUZ60_004590 [Juncus effusus]